MGVENGMFRSEIGSGFEDTGGTPPPRIPRSTPPGVKNKCHRNETICALFFFNYSTRSCVEILKDIT